MKTILIVEDNDMNRKLMETILDANGFARESATNGTDAIEIVRQTDVDLVLMDLQMSGTNGYDALMEIRGLCRHKPLPVIAVTGNATQADEKHALAAGFDGFVRKPFRIKELMDAIGRHLPLP